MDGRLPNLIGLSPHSVAWQKKQTIWTYDFVTGTMAQIWDATTNDLTGFVVSEKSGNLLLNCQDKEGPFQIELRPPIGNFDANIVNVTRPMPNPVQVDLDESLGRFNFKIKNLPQSSPIEFTWNGLSRYYSLGGNYLFFAGSISNDIPGIWQFDAKSKTVRAVAPVIDASLKWTKIAEPIAGIFTNKDGKIITYHAWQPIHKIQGKKYPAVIGKYINVWNPFQQIAANADWFFITIDLADWDMSAFASEMADLYDAISPISEIDTNKIFIIASSAQSPGVNQLFAERPDMAHGLIFYHPAGLVSLSEVHATTSILLLSGTDDDHGNLMKAQASAYNNGNPVKLLIQDGVQHNMNRSLDSEQELCWQFAKFLSQNK